MDPVFAWVEQLDVSVWIRETDSLFAFPFIITVHAIGFAMVVGTCFAIDFRLLGFLPKVPVPAMDKFVPIVWIGTTLNVVSGVLLVIAYPVKALTNPVFYFKLVLITAGLTSLIAIRRRVLHASYSPSVVERGKALAVTSLVLWTGAMTAGRLLAYTCKRLLVDSAASCP